MRIEGGVTTPGPICGWPTTPASQCKWVFYFLFF
jgi:hypothetical protein